MVRHNNLSSHHWLATLFLAFAMHSMAIAQEDDTEPRSQTPFSNPFGKFIKTPAPSRPAEPDPAPSSPNQESSGLGSFFMPLKSISNPFRPSSKRIENDFVPEVTPKPYREPFQDASNEFITKPAVAASPSQPQEKITRALNAAAAVEEPTSVAEGPKSEVVPPEQKTYAANPKIDTFDSKGTSRRVKTTTVSRTTERRPSESAPEEGKSVLATPAARTKPTRSDPPSPKAIPSSTNASGKFVKNSKSNRPEPTTPSNLGIDLHAPGLNLKLVGPDSILIGKPVPYELLATNEGQTSLNGLTIRLMVPAKVVIAESKVSEGNLQETSADESRGVLWEVKQLPAGSSHSLKIMIQTDQPQHFAMSLDWKIENPAIEIPIRVQQPQLILALEGPSEADFRKPQSYRLRVRNPGNATAEGVVVQLETQPNGSNEQVVGDLAPGSERVIEIELTFEQVGKVPVFAKAVSKTSNLEATRSIDVEVRRSLLIPTWDGPAEFYQGNTAEYTLTLENRGNIDALDNECRVELPTGFDVVSLPPRVSRQGSQLQWTIPRIAVGESSNWKFQFIMNQAGDQELAFESASSTGEPAKSTMQTKVDAVADLSLAVTDPISPAPVGKPVVYQITITNRGKKTAEDVFVIAQFSDGIEPIRIEGHSGQLVPGQVLFDNIPKIEPGQDLTLVITAEASRPGSHRFRAAVRCQGSEDDLLKEESTRYAATGTGSAK